MAIQRGFVQSIEARSDGWVEVVLLSVHGGNIPHTLFIESLDGDLTEAHRRLSKLALLRDALARTLPVEVSYEQTSDQGNVIQDVTALRTRSIDGRRGGWWVTGHIIGLTLLERGPEKDASPYTDEADLAVAAVLLDDGSLVSYTVDLQRPYEGTGHGILEMLAESRRTRRVIRLHIAPEIEDKNEVDSGFIVGAGWPTLEHEDLSEEVVFVERIGQRSESLDSAEPALVERVWIKYTTAPDQSPEGDISENGSFLPENKEAWVHQDSPLLARLMAALRDGLQVKLGLLNTEVHAAELVSHLGSAARPIWITFSGQPLCEDPEETCVNVPTIRSPTESFLNAVPHSVVWRGSAFFNEGIWRFMVYSGSPVELRIDGVEPCAEQLRADIPEKETFAEVHKTAYTNIGRTIVEDVSRNEARRGMAALMAHAYLDGLHNVEFIVRGRDCRTPFRALVYRIR